ncbi:hypothetical protein [Polynucleobacter sp. MWH-S4W17]|uniref:hypothetical protein n=1 Tax=Polynucleobacter sp. MWH-S4W17 TaxID=1855910 RepID=UPI001BFDBE72|nr:hypothetical protein [Polynucleobacter sp. MWH-S4W17]QWD82127.1 hypothetical protein C2755_02845 [Polynucleobacter sp. MWH-S4W17]
MIADDKKKLIEAEEIYRHEFKKTLETTDTSISKTLDQVVSGVKLEKSKMGAQIMALLNSSVGMWFLSSVVITGGAAVIQQIQHKYEVEQKNHAQLISYKFEIENRLDNMEYALRRAKTVGDAKDSLDRLFKSKFPLTPELQNRSLGSLYLNIYELVPGTEKQKAQAAINFIREMEDAEYLLQSQPDNKTIDDQEKARFNKLIQSIRELRLNAT